MREREVPDQGPGLDSVNELSPPPTEPHHDVHSRRFELHRDTAPAVPDGTDVRREVARLRRALSRLWEATNAHTRDDRTYDRLRADRDTLDEALLAVADEVSAAAPDEREATPDEAHDIGYTKGHTDGYREAMAEAAARPAPTVNEADVEITTAAELDALPAGTIVRDRFGGYLAQGRDAMGVAWFHYPVYDHAGSSALVAGIGPVTVCFTPGLTVADEGRAGA